MSPDPNWAAPTSDQGWWPNEEYKDVQAAGSLEGLEEEWEQNLWIQQDHAAVNEVSAVEEAGAEAANE